MEDYRYFPLPTPTSIRLLRIDRGKPLGTFNCSLKIVDLQDSPWYHAFSYTWGNPHAQGREGQVFSKHYQALDSEYSADQKQTILCDGKAIHINRNLYDAFGDVPRDAWRKFVNTKNKNGWTRLHIHAINGNVDGVRQSICSGTELDTIDNHGATALNWAARAGHLEIVKTLVEQGADVGIRNDDKMTALDYARQLNHPGMLEYLESRIQTSDHDLVGTSGDGPEVWMWIDQICINQADLQERGSQVGIMDQIYSKAAFTLVWLGREDAWTRRAMSTMSKLVGTNERFLNSAIVPYAENSEEVFQEADISYISMDDWESLAAVFQRQYFRRLWVVQENILSGVIVAYCGDVEIPWKDFCVVAQLLSIRQNKIGRMTSAKYIPLTEAGRPIEEPLVALIEWRSRWIHRDKPDKPLAWSQANLIFDTWNFRSTDPRDNVYAIYGLLSMAGTRPIDWKADYEKSVEQVFAEATKRIMSEAGDLRMLSAVLDHSFHQIPSLPSWVPDYSLTFTNMMASFFSAAGNLPKSSSPFSTLSPWNILKVRGVQIDTVLRLGAAGSSPGDSRYFFDPSWLELTLLLPSQYHSTGQSRSETLWRTLCANQAHDESIPAPLNYQEGFHEMMSRMLVRAAWLEEQEYRLRSQEEDVTDEMIGSISPSLQYAITYVENFFSEPPFSEVSLADWECEFSNPENSFYAPDRQRLIHTLLKLHLLSMTEDHQAATPTLSHLLEAQTQLEAKKEDPITPLANLSEYNSEFLTMLNKKKGRRRLFATEGRYIGLGPKSMEIGDEIWVLPGSGAAFVLRKLDGSGDIEPSSQNYKFIGETYVHGVMHGEAVDGKELDLRDISLD